MGALICGAETASLWGLVSALLLHGLAEEAGRNSQGEKKQIQLSHVLSLTCLLVLFHLCWEGGRAGKATLTEVEEVWRAEQGGSSEHVPRAQT